ncbi:hypothetical protein D3W53_24690 (plasmid) [Escherichia coli]|nr:hypothetical protein D3W53_24690 [Escherichia coli]
MRQQQDEPGRFSICSRQAAVVQADDRKRNELEELMLPIRKQYGALTKRRDRAGAAALEEAVLRALRAPIRKAEEK